MRHRVLVAFIVIVGLAIAAWLYSERMSAIKEKERLWKRHSGNQHSTLVECLDYSHGVQNLMERCMKIDKAVDKALGD